MPKVKPRFFVLSWAVIPAIGTWLAASYLLSVILRTLPTQSGQVLSAHVSAEEPVSDPFIPTDFVWKGSGLVTLWLDDAWDTEYTNGFLEMHKRNMRAALAVPTGLVQAESYMSWPQVHRAYRSGWEIVSHSVTHICEKDKLTQDFVNEELRDSQQSLWAHKLPADQFVAPCGVITDEIRTSAKQYYKSLRGTDEGYNDLPVKDPYTIYIQVITRDTTPQDVKVWLDYAKYNRKWLNIVFHQVDDSDELYSINPETFSQILDVIEAEKLPIVTPSEALQAGQTK